MTQVPGWRDVFGPLRALLEDPSVSEIMVNGPSRVYIEQKGLLKKTPVVFQDARQLLTLIEEIARGVGRSINSDNPYLDARLPDGSRVNCVIPPISLDGPSLTIRRFPGKVPTLQDLVNGKSLDERMAFFLHCCVAAKINVVVAGGTGSGKTTLLNALSFSIPPHERVVTIEDAAELRLKSENIVRLESRPSTSERKGIGTQELVINALRMRPDRIIVGECRGPETLDMLTAMNTGHDGSMTTTHANSPRDTLRRLETMIMMSGRDIPIRVVRSNVASALQLIVQVSRSADGQRRVTDIVEISGMEGDVILTQEIFRYTPGVGYASMGFVPRFVSKFADRGIDFPKDFFTDNYEIRMGSGSSK
ncbi:MAG: CpaF family protein [Bdellovibrionota bacterium]